MRLTRYAAVAAAAVLAGSALAIPAAHADNSSTLTIVGTSDVYDSNLIQSVIKPGFEAAYPGITLNYVSKGTGAAIAYAEQGTASALIVHAASLENQFVADGYSAEPYGRAIFWGDYVLLGPAADPAGVMTSGTPSHDIVSAYQKIATAGVAGHANFVSRGGTPGTTVQEHAIWALTSGVTTCTVSAANGGGASPSTESGACPATPTPPSWYHATGLTQGPNIINGDTCNYTGGGCYVFTDRGTYDYLKSQNSISNLKVVAEDNAANATGGSTLLVNSFHAYAVNAAKFAGNAEVQINSVGAQDFLNWVTSPAAQDAINNYLNNGTAVFHEDAAPAITATLTGTPAIGVAKVKVTGTVTNVVPGTPPLSGVQVKLLATIPGKVMAPITVATATTTSTGAYTLTYSASRTYMYSVGTGRISKIENSTLNPVFGDILVGTTLPVRTVVIVGSVLFPSVSVQGRRITVSAALAPKAVAGAQLQLLIARPGGSWAVFGTKTLAAGTTNLTTSFDNMSWGKWDVRLRYINNGASVTAVSAIRGVKIG